MDLRHGRWQDVLGDVGRVDAIITDPPYLSACGRLSAPRPVVENGRTPMGYDPATPELLASLCSMAGDKCNGWFVAFNDFDGVALMRSTLMSMGWTVAEPIAWVKPPAITPPRGALNLPLKGTEFICVARDGAAKKGRKPGSYIGPRSFIPRTCQFVTGGKPVDIMRAIIRDYTKPGDLVLDPFAGGGTTLLAAAKEGRRSIGCEMDAKTYETARKRLEAGYTPSMFP